MDKAEALEFIGLQEPLNEAALLSKYNARFSYFQMLYANAPNKVIEKIQQQNLEKLNQVKKILLEDIDVKKNNFNQKFSNAVAKSKINAGATEEKYSGSIF